MLQDWYLYSILILEERILRSWLTELTLNKYPDGATFNFIKESVFAQTLY